MPKPDRRTERTRQALMTAFVGEILSRGYVDVSVQPFVVAIVILLALATGIAGALYPAAYAVRIRAVEALRFE